MQAAVEKFGRIDVLVNNAGRGSLGAAEEFSVEQIRDQMEVNFIAAAEMIREVLPQMRARRSGHIVNVTSIGGRVNVGGFALYGAAKFALEGYSEALYDEVKPLGINVTLVEPGALRTEFAGDANVRPANPIADYDDLMEPLRQFLYGNSGKQAGDPHKAALVMIRAIESSAPPMRLMLGADAYGLWDRKREATELEMAAWREIGQDTAFADADPVAIPG